MRTRVIASLLVFGLPWGVVGCGDASDATEDSDSAEYEVRCDKNPTNPHCDKAPTVSIQSPSNGATVSGTVAAQGSSSDDKAVAKVEVRVDDGAWNLASGTTSWTFSLDTTALNDGGHTITARATDSAAKTTSTSVSVTVSNGSGGTPTGGYGPQASITCPAGAVDILPGMDVPQIVDDNPVGTSFCVRAGVHTPTRPIRPRTGMTLTGEYGAIIDGTNVTQSYDVSGTSIVSGWNCGGVCDNVTVRNLVVKNNTYVCIGATGSNGWHLDHVETSGCWQGVNLSMGSGGYVGYSYIHHNGKGIGTPELQQWGAGYGGYQSFNQIWEYNEMAHNPGDSKWSGSGNITFRHNHVHHQDYGIWFDGDNTGDLVEDNTFEDLNDQAVMNEVSGSLIVRNNTIRRIGGIAVFISTSRDTQVYNNDVTDAWRAISLFANCYAIFDEPPYPGMMARDLANNQIHDNTITVTANAKPGTFTSAFTWDGSCDSTRIAPYLSNAKGNHYYSNTYNLFSASYPTTTWGYGNWWVWGNYMTWAQWQAVPQDAGSIVSTP